MTSGPGHSDRSPHTQRLFPEGRDTANRSQLAASGTGGSAPDRGTGIGSALTPGTRTNAPGAPGRACWHGTNSPNGNSPPSKARNPAPFHHLIPPPPPTPKKKKGRLDFQNVNVHNSSHTIDPLQQHPLTRPGAPPLRSGAFQDVYIERKHRSPFPIPAHVPSKRPQQRASNGAMAPLPGIEHPSTVK